MSKVYTNGTQSQTSIRVEKQVTFEAGDYPDGEWIVSRLAGELTLTEYSRSDYGAMLGPGVHLYAESPQQPTAKQIGDLPLEVHVHLSEGMIQNTFSQPTGDKQFEYDDRGRVARVRSS